MLRFQILVPFIHEKKNESRMQKNDIKTSMGWRICSYSYRPPVVGAAADGKIKK